MKTMMMAAAIVFAGLSGPAVALEGGNADDGEQVFGKCRACHRIGEGATNLIGPVLNGVLGRPAGTAAGFSYSELNKNSGLNGLVWTEDLIFKYLEDPNTFLKEFLTSKGKEDLATGATKMVFKLVDEQDRKDVIAYVKKFSPPK